MLTFTYNHLIQNTAYDDDDDDDGNVIRFADIRS